MKMELLWLWGTRINPTCVDSELKTLVDLVYRHTRLENHIQTMLLEFKFIKMFFWGLDRWQASQEYDLRFRSVSTTCARQLRQMADEFPAEDSLCPGNFTNLEPRILYLRERIKPFKRQAKEICILLLGAEIRCRPCQQDMELFLEYGRETAYFIEFLLDNLQALCSEFHLIAPVKNQIDFIKGKLKAFGDFANPVSHWITRVKNLGELLSQTRTWANHLSCLACLYWIDHGMDETLASTMGNMLSDLMHKTMSSIPGVVALYFEGILIPQILARYFDSLLQELVLLPANDDIEILQEGFILLLSFMTDPPEEDSEDRELILEQIYSIINESPSLICSIHSSEMKDRVSETKLYDFLQKIAGVEDEVRKLYAITPLSAQFNSPRTNAMGFLDSLLQHWEKWLEGEVNLTARVTHGIQTVWEELAWLRHFMQNMTEIKNEEEEPKYLWNRIVDVVYYAAYVINLCLARSFSPWYGIICLPSVIEEIKLIKNEVREINDYQRCKSKMPSVEMVSRNTMPPQTMTSNVEGAFIGFREDTESIIDLLVRGRKELTIISISGMAGQGKTTLAKYIYNDVNIQRHFGKTVWCYVSKDCKIRDMLIHIVCVVRETDSDNEDISKLEIQDLAEKLRKSLKGRRYLIVMDDIWDVGVWCQVQSSFPDDKKGSRILFTSRNHNLISQDERNFISYPLRSFSDEESWDLMKEKVSHHDGLGSEFLEIGRQIAICCKGLPLAVALVAPLLGKTEQKLELWNQVAEKLKSHLASEGCMHIIELSFKYLPEHLKSCFLYFGAFPRGKNISAKRLKLLWIAEGFIKENETRCSKDLAEECLDYLVSQSLVVVAERSSVGGIKKCNVHDLLYDLCLEKIAEDNFLHSIDWETIGDECRSNPQKYAHHRLCIGGSDPFIETRPIRRRKELPTSPVQSLLWFSGDDFHRASFSFLESFEVLTVLDLAKVKMKSDVFPEVILCNIHLKYLALWGSCWAIPPSIDELRSLETLILEYYGTHHRMIPSSMWRMKSLRHVRIDRSFLSLKDFEGNETYMAALDNMETLCGLFLEDDDPRTMEFFWRMTRLRKLKCIFRGDELNPTWFSFFVSLENLEELKISSDFHLVRFRLMKCINMPREENLGKLRLEGPQKNLKKLSLVGSSVESWSEMSTIGKQFPNLEVLKLDSVGCKEGSSWESEDEDIECKESRRWELEDGEFSNLRYLKLRKLYHLEEINVSDDCDNPFPCLELLIVDACRSLKKIPSEIGEIGGLNTINMSGCSRKASESVMQILEQQRDLGNHSLQVFVKGEEEEEETEEEETEGKAEAIEEDESDDDEQTEKEEEDESVDDEQTEEVVESNLKKENGKLKLLKKWFWKCGCNS